MAFSSLVIIGLLAVAAAILFRRKIIDGGKKVNINSDQNEGSAIGYCSTGLRLFLANASLFGVTVLILYLLTFLLIPYIHLLVMLLAVVSSIHMWSHFHRVWKGDKTGRIKFAFIGSSFYLLVDVIFMWLIFTVQPSYPGEDMFMATISLFFGMVVATVAFFTCFIFVGLPVKKR